MWERLECYFLSEPERLIELGRFLFGFGTSIVLCGLWGKVATISPIGLIHTPSTPVAAKTLAEILPNIPTWWIPESFEGFIPAVCFVIAGILCVLDGKRYKKIL